MNTPKILIITGIILIILGIIWLLFQKFNMPLGRLPGDIYIKKENFAFYFPITTGIILSIIISLIIWLIGKK